MSFEGLDTGVNDGCRFISVDHAIVPEEAADVRIRPQRMKKGGVVSGDWNELKALRREAPAFLLC